MKKILSSEKVFKFLLIGFLFFPLFFHGPRFGIPYVKGGDESHYLVMLNSLLIDEDLDLKNNYESARKGSWQVGKKFAGAAVDPHIVWVVEKKPVIWTQVYEDTDKWKKGTDGFFIPERKPGIATEVDGLPQHSSHPAGIAFLLAPFLWVARETPYTEPLGLFCSNLAIIFAAFLFRAILKLYSKDPLAVNLGTLLTFLGMPLWAYSRMFFMEPFLTLFAIGAFYLVLRKTGKENKILSFFHSIPGFRRKDDSFSGLWAGLLLGLGALLKPNFLILFFPLSFFYLKEKKYKDILLMGVGPALATLAVLYTNALWYGSPLTPAQPFRFGNIFQGMLGLSFSWNHGIICFAPVALLALVLWKKFLRERKSEALLIAGGFGIYFLMMSLFECWWGGWCYGPRLVLPVLPLLMVPILYLPKAYGSWSKTTQWLAIGLCLLSIVFNLLGAFDGYWDSHPLTILKGNIS